MSLKALRSFKRPVLFSLLYFTFYHQSSVNQERFNQNSRAQNTSDLITRLIVIKSNQDQTDFSKSKNVLSDDNILCRSTRYQMVRLTGWFVNWLSYLLQSDHLLGYDGHLPKGLILQTRPRCGSYRPSSNYRLHDDGPTTESSDEVLVTSSVTKSTAATSSGRASKLDVFAGSSSFTR